MLQTVPNHFCCTLRDRRSQRGDTPPSLADVSTDMTQSSHEITGSHIRTPTDREFHRLLTTDRARMTLDILAERTEPIEIEALAAEIAAQETGGIAADGRAVANIALVLHHVHLPRMNDLGVIDYDPTTTRVESYSVPIDF